MKKQLLSNIAAILSVMAALLLCLTWGVGHGTHGVAIAASPDAALTALPLVDSPPILPSVYPGVPPNLPDDPPPPLPSDCSLLALPGEDPPAACVYGYVLLDGLPVSGASVIIESETGYLQVLTQSGPASPMPYFAAALTIPPLSAPVEELVKVDATFSGQSNTTTFSVVENGQQVDLWLSSICGPTLVPGGLISTDTTWSPDCGPYVITGDLLVPNGIKLTVLAGTTVRFDADVALQVDGVVYAQGTANAMIVFTSNGSGAPGDWGYILLRETVAPEPYDYLTYVLVEYAGGVSVTDNAALRVDGAWPILHDITVRDSASDGVHFYNGAIGAISRAAVYDNAGWGIYANSSSLSAANNALQVHHNLGGGVYIKGTYPHDPVWLMDSTIRDNSGRGIDAYQVDLYVSDSLIHRNRASTGAGIYVSYTDLSLSDSWVSGNVASSSGGGIYCHEGALCLLHHNVINDNSAGSLGGGMYINSGKTHEIQHNIFSGNAAANGGGLALGSASIDATIANNAFLDNTATSDGAAIYVIKDIAIIENTILHNTAGQGRGGIYTKNNPLFNFNNLYGNSDYDLYNGTPQGATDLNAEYNWWGTISYAQIMAHIWDWFDNPSLGLVDYDPWLASHYLLAPISPPTGLAASSNGITVTLTWSSSPEADLAGYKVYYDADGPGFPYNGTGASEGDAPVDVGNVLSATLTGLAPGTYYLSVTAYDTAADGADDQTEGNESWFAYEVTAHLGEEPHADFTAALTSGIAPLIVTFTNGSTGDYSTCAWSFGDGGTSSNCSNPSHTYSVAGIYTVALTVSGPGGSDTRTRSNYISVYEPVHADFTAAPTSGIAPLIVTFTNGSTGDYSTCAWSFGDGGASSNCSNPSHTYSVAGIYIVALTVSGSGGMDTLTRPNYIAVYAEEQNIVHLPLILRSY